MPPARTVAGGEKKKRVGKWAPIPGASKGKKGLGAIPEDEEIKITASDQESEATRRAKGSRPDRNYRSGRKRLAESILTPWRKRTAKNTMKETPVVIRRNELYSGNLSYLLEDGDIPPVHIAKFPNIRPWSTTRIRVIRQDSFDCAVTLMNSLEILNIPQIHRVCVLNCADPERSGGDWKDAATDQEAQLCYRSTLAQTLLPEYYPLKESSPQCVYSPNVFVFKENEELEFFPMWVDLPDRLPMVAVVSMSADENPPIDYTGRDYGRESDRTLMMKRMRFMLRVAADTSHRVLVLRDIGSDYGHPNMAVADCWLKVLKEEEFRGWFIFVVFALGHLKDHYDTFRPVLHNVDISYPEFEGING
ncbi:hypothetical protein N7466_004999 [Penicillium verhagenii]|uniref:uncharacterized protein n=1 Tax=Penicillium verhagenii TaxID=1562060 RepID=UPI0025457C15|nr:uncharacterized protein N7466_004999 [Penicillium verhagenii]KAJ5935452.1 hypothetical protein N7466_004999 [Penicillium verhagenii]